MKILNMAVLFGVITSLAAVTGNAQTVKLKATYKETDYAVSAGKIVKTTVGNKQLVTACTTNAGAQLVAAFDETTKEMTELDVVDECGNLLCQVGTFVAYDPAVQDTGIVSGNEEIISPLTYTPAGGLNGDLTCDTKIRYDGGNNIKSGSLKCSGVMVIGTDTPASVTISCTALFKPASTCP